MKKISFALMITLSVMSGCCTAVMPSEKTAVQDDIMRSHGEKVVKAIVSQNYSDFAEAAGEADDAAGSEEFLESCSNLEQNCGKSASYRFLGRLDTPLMDNQLWAVQFTKQAADGGSIVHEQLLQLVFVKQDGRTRLLGMRFIM